MAANTHKHQHYVPQSYLSAWCDPETPAEQEPYVWRYPKAGGDPRRKSPRKIFHETDMYTVNAPGAGHNGRDLRIEKTLSQLETGFVEARDKFLLPRKPLPPIQQVKLLAFFAALFARTPAARERVLAQWQPILKHMDELKAAMEALPLEERKARQIRPLIGAKGGGGMTQDQVRAVVRNPLQHSIGPMIKAVVESIYKLDMNLCVLCTDDPIGFITSDDPVTWHDPDAYKRPSFYRSVALMYETVELIMPVAPSRLLLISHKPLDPYLNVPLPYVDDYNRRTRFFSDRYFIVRRPETRPIWFDPGQVPADIEETAGVQ